MERTYFIYILANRKNGTLYLGFTGNLHQRVISHKEGKCPFTAKYGVKRLVYVESSTDVQTMRTRERRMKAWKREWKTNLIEKDNPEWEDLFEKLIKSEAHGPQPALGKQAEGGVGPDRSVASNLPPTARGQALGR